MYWQALFGKRTPMDIFIKDANSVLLKGILNRLREYFCELLKLITVQHLETSEGQIGEEIHLTEAKVSTKIKSLKAGKASGEDDIRP